MSSLNETCGNSMCYLPKGHWAVCQSNNSILCHQQQCIKDASNLYQPLLGICSLACSHLYNIKEFLTAALICIYLMSYDLWRRPSTLTSPLEKDLLIVPPVRLSSKLSIWCSLESLGKKVSMGECLDQDDFLGISVADCLDYINWCVKTQPTVGNTVSLMWVEKGSWVPSVRACVHFFPHSPW